MAKQRTKIALIKGEHRYSNISAVLELLQAEITDKIKAKKKILIKPNFVSTTRQLAATHVDTVRAVLDFILPLKDKDAQIIIGEGAALGPTQEGFRNFGYLPLVKQYPVKLTDLNLDEDQAVKIYDSSLNLFKAHISRMVTESDFRISLALPKTHDSTVVTLSLKNMAVGALIGHEKSSIHQGPPAINRSLARLAQIIPPHLAVIDGLVGMQGNGPVHGDALDCHWALASLDFLAADTIATQLMGFDWRQIGYLYFCHQLKLGQTDLLQIEILGNTSIKECQRKFRPHDGLDRQLKWR